MTKPEPSAPALLIEADPTRNQVPGNNPPPLQNQPPCTGGMIEISSPGFS